MAGRLDLAMEAYERHYSYLVQSLDENHPLLQSVLDFMYRHFIGLTLTGSTEKRLTRYRGRADKHYLQALEEPVKSPHDDESNASSSEASTQMLGGPTDKLKDLCNTTRLLYMQGDCKSAIRLQLHILNRFKETLPTDHPQIGVEVKFLGMMYEKLGFNKEAQSLYRESVGIFEESLGPSDQMVAQALIYEGYSSHENGMNKEALFCLDRSLMIFKEHNLPDDHLTVVCINLLKADVYGALKEGELAEDCIINFFEGVKDQDAGSNPANWELQGAFGAHPVAWAMNSAAKVCAAGADYVRARAYAKGAHSLQTKYLGVQHATTKWTVTYMEKLSFMSAWKNHDIPQSIKDIKPRTQDTLYAKLARWRDQALGVFKPTLASNSKKGRMQRAPSRALSRAPSRK